MDPGFFYETVVGAPPHCTPLCLPTLTAHAVAGPFTFNRTC